MSESVKITPKKVEFRRKFSTPRETPEPMRAEVSRINVEASPAGGRKTPLLSSYSPIMPRRHAIGSTVKGTPLLMALSSKIHRDKLGPSIDLSELRDRTSDNEADEDYFSALAGSTFQSFSDDLQIKLAEFGNLERQAVESAHQISLLSAKVEELESAKLSTTLEDTLKDIKVLEATERILRLEADLSQKNEVILLTQDVLKKWQEEIRILLNLQRRYHEELESFQTSSKALISEKDQLIECLSSALATAQNEKEESERYYINESPTHNSRVRKLMRTSSLSHLPSQTTAMDDKDQLQKPCLLSKAGHFIVKSRSKLPKVEKRPVTIPKPFSFVIREQEKKIQKLEKTQKVVNK